MEHEVARTEDLLRIQALEKALRNIVNMLGPEPPSCTDTCDGCLAEMTEALRIAKEALDDATHT
jgi:hypothetical protein